MNNRWRRQLDLSLRYFRFRHPQNSLFRYVVNPIERVMIESKFQALNYCYSLAAVKYKHTPSFRKGAKHYATKHR